MSSIEVTSLSSRGQIVIPQSLRERLSLHTGEKFVVVGEDDTIVLKRIEMPSFKGFDKLLKKTRKYVKTKGIRQSDLIGSKKSKR